jgi:hypothetical protein
MAEAMTMVRAPLCAVLVVVAISAFMVPPQEWLFGGRTHRTEPL